MLYDILSLEGGVYIMIVEKIICDTNFSYLHPYFYNNEFALRCELGIGDNEKEYMENAEKRAFEIYNILFPNGADAIFFNYWDYDYLCDGDANSTIIPNILEEKQQLTLLKECFKKYRHKVVKNLETYDAPEDDTYNLIKRHRIICYADKKAFNYKKYILAQINGKGQDISFVSFDNECIFSIYDDRGCDIVLLTKPYFLDFDMEEMNNRYNNTNV